MTDNSKTRRLIVLLFSIAVISFQALAQTNNQPGKASTKNEEKHPLIIGNLTAIHDSKGMLLPWITWDEAINKEMQ